MSELLPKELENILPKIGGQEGIRNPTIYAVFQFPLSGWIWFAAECDVFDDDICFFGYVVGLENEWGNFFLSELESIDINGIRVFRDENHVVMPLSECLQLYGLVEN